MNLYNTDRKSSVLPRAAGSNRSAFIRGLNLIVWYLLLVVTILFAVAARVDADEFSTNFLEGFSQPLRISSVASTGTGVVQRLKVAEGAEVAAGQCLVELDHSVHDKQLESARLGMIAEGELQSAEAQLKASTQRLSIIRELAQHGSATPEELVRAENEFSLASANLLNTREKQALRKVEYERLLEESEKFCVVAPFDGVLVEHLRALGEFVGPVDPNVCVVADLSNLSVNFLVPRSFRQGFHMEQVVEVHFVESNLNLPGVVYYISPFASGDTNTFQVKIRVENSRRSVNAGERCIVEFLDGKPTAGASAEYVSTEATASLSGAD